MVPCWYPRVTPRGAVGRNKRSALHRLRAPTGNAAAPYCALHPGMRGAVCDLQRGIARAFLDTYPRRLWGMRKSARRGLRRDVDGAIHRLMWPRSAPGRRANGSRSRRRAATVVGDRPAMAWNWRPPHRGTWPKGPQICSDAQNRRRGCRKATPGAVRPLGSQRWLPEETHPGLLGLR